MDVGLIGLGTMGANLARNIADKKFRICVYNRTPEVTAKFIEDFGNTFLTGETNLKKFVQNLSRPRKIILLVKAGEAVDAVIHELLPLLQRGDIIIDGGNSYFKDTQRREKELQGQGINFIGSGISGGEVGALYGPSLMPGGAKSAWQELKPIWKTIAAKDSEGKPCVTYVGENGAGHYVKMVHNGIEYGLMQIIAETYDCLRTLYKLKPDAISKIFREWSKGKLQSYLFEITANVLDKKDEFKSGYLIDYILDSAAQKGT